MPTRSLLTKAGSKAWRAEVADLRNWQTRFRDLSNIVTGEREATLLRRGVEIIKQGFFTASYILRDAGRASLASKGGSRRLDSAIYAFADLDKGRTAAKRRTSLVGVRTGAPPRLDRAIYRIWGRGSKRRNGSIAAGGLGISLARIIESGTRFQRGTNFFRDAIRNNRSRALAVLIESYKQAVRLLTNG